MSAAFTPEFLVAALEPRPAGATGDVCVAFSGGLDSTVLLVALADARRAGWPHAVRAIHTDHQIHADSGAWQERCAGLASAHGVPYTFVRIAVPVDSGLGLEAAAREARYSALHGQLQPGETLLTAHHADDQLETLLLALMRGSGARGLSGMPRTARAGAGWHSRPLLDFTRAELASWAQSRGLNWIEDPANRERRFRRSFLRHEVVPQLRSVWPEAAAVASRSARHLAEASELIDDLARQDQDGVAIEHALSIPGLAGLSSARRRNVLRFWIRGRGLPLPTTVKLHTLEHDMMTARPDRQLCVAWEGAEIRAHRGLLYAGPPLPELGARDAFMWDWREPCRLPASCGELGMIAGTGEGLGVARLPAGLECRWRAGGEVLQPARESKSRSRHRTLKNLLQEAGVLPWWRERLPILAHGDQIVAVADLWVAADFAAAPGKPGVRVEWRNRPAIFAARDSIRRR